MTDIQLQSSEPYSALGSTTEVYKCFDVNGQNPASFIPWFIKLKNVLLVLEQASFILLSNPMNLLQVIPRCLY